ncbi:MAG: MBL fold metallo-hydrolase [Phycisphaerales bacterium]|jgi:ribonuclease BN (tRNA processing enzyme)
MSLRLFIGGMRGSRPAIGSGFDEFGGDTTSLLVVGSQGERLVLDAGTGLRNVAVQLAPMEPGEATVVFSHYHLDHMAGLTMNPLFYRSDWSFRLVGPTLPDAGVRDAVTRLLAQPYWPISWKQMNARLTFSEFPEDGLRMGSLRVRACPTPHPGGSVAYRIDDADSGTGLVFATDIEWQKRTSVDEAAFMALCREPGPADLLVMDAHFGDVDKKAFAGWGHSSREDDLAIAAAAGIQRVLLGHHAPEADDTTLRAVEQQVKRLSPGAALARAGQWLTVGD